MNTTSAITPTIATTMNMSENTQQQHLVKENVETWLFSRNPRALCDTEAEKNPP
jgi:hypothetical protein